jgi:hypothetical protein
LRETETCRASQSPRTACDLDGEDGEYGRGEVDLGGKVSLSGTMEIGFLWIVVGDPDQLISLPSHF